MRRVGAWPRFADARESLAAPASLSVSVTVPVANGSLECEVVFENVENGTPTARTANAPTTSHATSHRWAPTSTSDRLGEELDTDGLDRSVVASGGAGGEPGPKGQRLAPARPEQDEPSGPRPKLGERPREQDPALGRDLHLEDVIEV